MPDSRQIIARVLELIEDSRFDDACELLDAALKVALDRGTPRAVTALLGATAPTLAESCGPQRALSLVDRVLESVDADLDPIARGRLLAQRSGLLRGPRNFEAALADQSEAIALLEGRVSDETLTTLRHDRAVILADLGYLDEAVTGLVAAREAFLGMRDRVGVAASDHNLGFVLHDLGALDDAIEYLTEARDIFLAIDMPEEAASCDQNLGVVLYDAGRLADAGRRFAVAHHRFIENEAFHSAAECDANVSTLLTTMGRPDEAARYRRRAQDAGVGIPTVPGSSSQTPIVTVAVAAADEAVTVGTAVDGSDSTLHEAGSVGSASA